MIKRTSPASGLQIKAAKNRFIALPCAALLLFIFGFITLPYAEATLRANAAGSQQSQVYVGVTEAWASLTTSGNVYMSIDDPSPSGNIVIAHADVTASTNSPSGYKLYLSGTDIASGNTADLINDVTPSAPHITPLNTAATETFSTVNTWGFALEGDDSFGTFSQDYTGALETKLFKGVSHLNSINSSSENGLIASSTRPRPKGAKTDVHYAAYINSATTTGTYLANVTYTLVAEFAHVVQPGEDNPYLPDIPDNTNPGPSAASEDGGEPGTTLTAQGVNETIDAETATIGNLSDGNITWAAIAIIAGASATFLAIALLRDRDEEDEEA